MPRALIIVALLASCEPTDTASLTPADANWSEECAAVAPETVCCNGSNLRSPVTPEEYCSELAASNSDEVLLIGTIAACAAFEDPCPAPPVVTYNAACDGFRSLAALGFAGDVAVRCAAPVSDGATPTATPRR